MVESAKPAQRAEALACYQRDNGSPLRWIVLATLLLVVAVWAVAALLEGLSPEALFTEDWTRAHATRWMYERHVFALYACGFVAWWLVYFGSRKPEDAARDHVFRRVRTLRRLLGECATQWKTEAQIARGLQHRSAEAVRQDRQELEEVEANYRDKATSSMTTIAILIAVSALELQEVSNLLAPLIEQQTTAHVSWQIGILVLSLALAMVALIAYIVSADALDVIFNNFVDDDARHRITRYYYQRTINPRYAALISLIASFILLVAYYSPLAASVAIGLFFVIGYPHWFPDFAVLPQPAWRRARARLAAAVIVLLPLSPMLLGWRA